MAIEDLRWAEFDINFPETSLPNKVGTSLPTILQDEGFHPYSSYDAEVFNEWMNRAWKSVQDLQAQIDALSITAATGVEPAFPIGSLYVNFSDNTDPTTLLGFGVWEKVEGVTLAGAGQYTDSRGESRTFVAGDLEGTYKHSLTAPEGAPHRHELEAYDNNRFLSVLADNNAPNAYGHRSGINEFPTTAKAQRTTVAGSGVPHNNMQPTLFVHMWKRVA